MCGIFGIENNKNASQIVFAGLLTLQHRGQESAGIAVYDEKTKKIARRAGLGNVSVALPPQILGDLKGGSAIGHVRYPTAGCDSSHDSQPFLFDTKNGLVALAHNGNIYNDSEIADKLQKTGAIFAHTSDSERIMHLIERQKGPLDKALPPALKQLNGAYALIFLKDGVMTGARDPYGIRPLVLGRLDKSYILSSETVAVEMTGGKVIREIAPGEIIVISGGKIIKSFIFQKKRAAAPCIFEQVYFSQPASKMCGQSIAKARMAMGLSLARSMKHIKADFVMPVPDSGIFAALGFSKEAGIPMEMGLVRNNYMGRSFIAPTQQIRENLVKIKLFPLREKLKGAKIVVIDDSLVRGTTARNIMRLLRQSGVKEIHFALSSPPVVSPCFYGINTPTKDELMANRMNPEEIRKFIEADSLTYLSLKDMEKAARGKSGCKTFCAACFTGKYPTGIKI